jgi:hypothetical protein
MYNRYIRNDDGVYSRIPQEEPSQQGPRPAPPLPEPPPHCGEGDAPGRDGPFADGLTGFLRHVLDQMHLDHVDTGDLLVLALLFFLFREEADEELLVALGLLLIL